MAVNDSEKKTRAILESRAEKGKELQQFQEAQGQLLNLQAEQRNNLNEQRVISGMEMQNNQTLAQAAEVLAASGGAAGGVMAAQPRQRSGTQSVLNKFGLKPGQTTRTTQTTTQTPQKVSITNNTTTTNNNNIQLSQPQIPMSAPQIPVRAGAAGGDTVKFKAWINNAFAKQNEAAAIREKEYQRREWSLTRSTNKMIRKMGELGKAFAEKMSPKNLGNILGDQLKVVMFLMGFQYLAENFKGFLGKIDDLLNWFSDKKGDGFFGGFKQSMVEFIGGKKGESFISALGGLFSDVVDRIGDRLENILTIRGKAIKEVKFPEIDISKMDLGGIISALGGYLGDVISTAFSGTAGLTKSALRSFKQKGIASSLEHYDDKFSHTQDASHLLMNTRNTSLGDAILADKDFSSNFKMAAQDYDSFGGLRGEAGASVKQSQHLSNLIRNMKNGGAVETSQFFSGFSALKTTASRKKGVCVTEQFIDDIGLVFKIPEAAAYVKASCPVVHVRYIVVPKTFDDRKMENAGNFLETTVSSYVTNKAISKTLGGTASNAAGVAKELEKGNYVSAANQATWGMLGSGPRAVFEGAGAEFRNWTIDDYTVKMVRTDDPNYPRDKYPTARGKDGKPLVDVNNNTYLWLSYSAIVFLENQIRKNSGVNFSFNDDSMESAKLLDKMFVDYGNQVSGGKSTTGLSDIEEAMYTISDLENQERALNEAYELEHSNDRVANMAANTKNLFKGGGNEVFSGNYNKINLKRSENTKSERITSEEARRNAIEIADRLLKDPDLNLTPAQVSGILGNIGVESGFNPKANNPNDLGQTSSGLVQWRGDRRDKFYEKYNKYPNDSTITEQVSFLKHELLSTEKETLKAIKGLENGTPEEYAEIFMNKFERPADDVKINHLDRRKSLAVGAAELINETVKNTTDYNRANEFTYTTGLGKKVDFSSIWGQYHGSTAAKIAKIQQLEDEGGLVNEDGYIRNLYKDLENASTAELIGNGYLAGLYNRYKAGTLDSDLSRPVVGNDNEWFKDKVGYGSDSSSLFELRDLLSKDYYNSVEEKEGGTSSEDIFGIITDLIKNSPYVTKFLEYNDEKQISRYVGRNDSARKVYYLLKNPLKILEPNLSFLDALKKYKNLLSGSSVKSSNILFHIDNKNKSIAIAQNMMGIGDSLKGYEKLSDSQAEAWVDYSMQKHVVPNLDQLFQEGRNNRLEKIKEEAQKRFTEQAQDERALGLVEADLKNVMGDKAWEEIVSKDGTKKKVYNFGDIENRLTSAITDFDKFNSDTAKSSIISSTFSEAEIDGFRAYFNDYKSSDEVIIRKAGKVFSGTDDKEKLRLYKKIVLAKEAEQYGLDASKNTYEEEVGTRKYIDTVIDQYRKYGLSNEELEELKTTWFHGSGIDEGKISTLMDKIKTGEKLTGEDYKLIEQGAAEEIGRVKTILKTSIDDVATFDNNLKIDNNLDPLAYFNALKGKSYLTPNEVSNLFLSKNHSTDLQSLTLPESENLQVKTSLNQADLLSALVQNTYLMGNQIQNLAQITAYTGDEQLRQLMGIQINTGNTAINAGNNSEVIST